MTRTKALAEDLRRLVGRRHVLARPDQAAPFTTGYRCGGGSALVVRPGSLVEMWRVLQACVAADANVILQAANTGLTGGSTPWGEYEQPVVLINTLRLAGVRLVRGGDQVVCLPGATLDALTRALRPLGREPHSEIGSSCIGASVIGGVCNNSGGALVRRGPAFTELALFARLDAEGRLELINHLDIDLGRDPEEILARLDAGVGLDDRLQASRRRGSDGDYEHHVRDVQAATPARFNADPRRLIEAAGSAGKVAVFAVRLDTYPREPRTATFYVGAAAPEILQGIRRSLLSSPRPLPIAAEYLHRTAFDIAAGYGKDMFLAIQALGAERLPLLYRLKGFADELAGRSLVIPKALSDHLLQAIARMFPQHLPARLREFRDLYEHHLILKVAEPEADFVRGLLAADVADETGGWFECTPDEADKAFRHRFVAAGAAIRYRAVHRRRVSDIVALDVALPRSTSDWTETLGPELDAQVVHKLYYGHFLCHVFHQDYILRQGIDPAAFEAAVCDRLDARGAEYPAEHNVGHLYEAKPALAAHYRALDPCNRFNPGVGRLTRQRDWLPEAACRSPHIPSPPPAPHPPHGDARS
jgi:D-lactate dehydrogenase